VVREAKTGKKAILARKAHRDRRDQKEKEASRVHKDFRGYQVREATPAARAYPALKVPRDLQGQRAKKATRVHRVSLALKGREATLVARAYPVLKVPKDPQGQRANLADPVRPQQLEAAFQNWKSDWLRQGKELPCRPKGWMSPI
jgi:hypothetical protein